MSWLALSRITFQLTGTCRTCNTPRALRLNFSKVTQISPNLYVDTLLFHKTKRFYWLLLTPFGTGCFCLAAWIVLDCVWWPRRWCFELLRVHCLKAITGPLQTGRLSLRRRPLQVNGRPGYRWPFGHRLGARSCVMCNLHCQCVASLKF